MSWAARIGPMGRVGAPGDSAPQKIFNKHLYLKITGGYVKEEFS
jgi:hypothetical protein